MPTARNARETLRNLLESYDRKAVSPRGFSPIIDIRRLGPPAIEIVFDVGANVGQSSTSFLRAFPNATVYAFEPAASTYRELHAALANKDRARTFNTAMGRRDGTAYMQVDADSVLSAITDDSGGEAIAVRTIDSFCSEHGLSGVDFLKIDTEGHDLHVIEGAGELISRRAVRAIQVEAGMHPENDTHVAFEELKADLEGRGYRVFGIYEQVAEWLLQKPWLRRVDVLFIPA